MNGDDDGTAAQSSLSANIVIQPVVHPGSSDSTTSTAQTSTVPDSSFSDLTIQSTPAATEENGHTTGQQDLDLRDKAGKPVVVVLESGEGEGPEPSPDPATGGETAPSNGEGQEWLPDGDHELKRVKVYELIGSRWVDQGTAFCFGQFQEDTNDAFLIARSEANYQEVILSTAIRSNDVYQRQQDTLIVWTEPDGVDYALSFQDPEGCSEVWNFILDVQRHMNGGEDQTGIISSPLIGPEPSITTAAIMRSGHLPTPQIGIIEEIERAIRALARTVAVKERICEYIQQEDYIKSLIDVMHQAEDLESLENLHALCSIMQTILMLNDHSMYEHILEDDIFFGVVGMLEYDPEFPTHKANYREFLHQTSRFHQPILIRDEAIQRKIHHTYRLQFMKDVVLARALDDSTFNVLNSCIIFNQIDIITHVQQDPAFLKEVVSLYVDEDMLSGGGVRKPLNQKEREAQAEKGRSGNMDVDHAQGSDSSKTNGTTPNVRSSFYAFAPPEQLSEEEITLRREVIFLIQQLCVMGKNVQLPARMALFRALVDRGILFAVQWALSLPEREEPSRLMISVGGEILAGLLDHDLNGVRGHVLKQVIAIEKEKEAGKKGADKAETILALMCRLLAQSRDLGVQSQVGDALKVMLDIPRTDGPEPHTAAAGVKLFARAKDDPGTEKFLDYFYKHCIDALFKPFDHVPEFRTLTEPVFVLTREKTNLYLYLCDLLCGFALQHSFRSHFFILSSNISVRMAALLKARDKHLQHAAFRFFRVCLKLNNRNLQNHLIKHDVLKPILDLTLQESRRDNLLSSSCQEYFEHMRRENVRDMIKHCMTKHETEIRKLAESPLGSRRFSSFIRRWEMNNEPLPPEPDKPEKPVDTRLWPGQGRLVEAEEEDYFNTDDDEDDHSTWNSKFLRGPLSPGTPINGNTLKRKRRPAVSSIPRGFRPNALSPPPLGTLVDYDEDDDDLVPVAHDFGPTRTPLLTPTPQKTLLPHTKEIPTSPRMTHRQIPPSPRHLSGDDDEQDNMLETLVRPKTAPPSTPPPVVVLPELGIGSMRPSGKRRREEEEDGLLERLTKSKKVEVAGQKGGGGPGRIGPAKLGDDPPKKMKLKFGATSLAVASSSPSTPAPSEPGAKDGDTG